MTNIKKLALLFIVLSNQNNLYANHQTLLISNERFRTTPETQQVLVSDPSFAATVMKDYVQVKENYSYQIYGVKSVNYILQTGLTFGAAGLSEVSPLSAPWVAVGAKITMDSVNTMAQHAISGLEGKSALALRLRLNMYRQTHSLNELRQLSNLNENQIYKIVYGDATLFDNPTYRSLNSKEKDVYHNFLFKTIADEVAGNRWAQSVLETESIQRDDIVLKELEAKFYNTSEQFSALTKFTVHFQKETYEKLYGLTKTTQKIKVKIQKIYNSVKTNGKEIRHNGHHIEFIQEFMYGNMDPISKQSVLKKGWLPGLTGSDRELVEDEVELLVEHQHLQKTFSEVASTVSHLAVIANGFGLDPDIVKAIGEASQIANAANSVVSNLVGLPPNYLGALASVAGLFGGRSNPAAERHKQVMRGIGMILKNQGRILKGIDFLAKGQEAILSNQKSLFENQKRIYDSVLALHKNVQENYIDLKMDLHEIKLKVQDGNLLDLVQLENNVNKCFPFLKKGSSQLGGMKTIDTFSDYAQLSLHFYDRGHLFADCLSGIESVLDHFHSTSEFHPLVRSRFFEHPTRPTVENYIENVYRPLYRFHTKQTNQPADKVLSEQLYAQNIVRYSYLIMEMAPFYQLIENLSTGQLLVQSDLNDTARQLRSRGRDLLKEGLRLVDTALAQQEFLAGGTIISSAIEILESNQTENRKNLIEALRHNPVAAKNVVLEMIAQDLASGGYSPGFYEKFRTAPGTDHFLRKLSRNHFGFHFSKGTWKSFIRINKDEHFTVAYNSSYDFLIDLPTGNQIQKRGYSMWSDVNLLRKVRNELINEIVDYGFWNRVRPDARSVIIDAQSSHYK